MEAKLPLKAIFAAALVFFSAHCALPLAAQVLPRQRALKFQAWTLMEGIPGLEEKVDESRNGIYSLPLSHLRTSIPFVLEGLVYGWTFAYTPSDKQRGVEESFEYDPIGTVQLGDEKISFSQFKADDSYFSCWVSYERTDEMMAYRAHWESINHPRIQGRGAASIFDGDEGIRAAYGEALKLAVRGYAQGVEKNKPKEISGKVLLVEAPKMAIASGKYVVTLKFLLDIDEILPYSAF